MNAEKKPRQLGSVLWVGVGAALLGLIAARIFAPDRAWVTVALCVALVGVLAGLVREYRKALTGRAAAYGLNSAITVALVLGIVGVLNFLSSKHFKDFDLTKNRKHSLSDQTVKVVSGLGKPVKATLFSKMGERERFRTTLNGYAGLSPKFEVEYVDPDTDPVRAKQAAVKKYDTLVLAYEDRTSKVEEINEQSLTNALIKLLKTQRQTVCAVTGHGEKGVRSREEDGFEAARQGLEDQGYAVKEVNLPQEAKLPADCTSVMILGPTAAFFDSEIKALDEFAAKGGRVLVAVDASLKGGEPSKEIVDWLKRKGVEVGRALIVDPLSRMLGVDAAVPIIATYNKEHAITKVAQGNGFFPFARPLALATLPEGAQGHWLFKTTPKSWGETDFGALTKGAVSFEAGKDKTGPLDAGIAVETKGAAGVGSRLVVLATSQFANNRWSRFGNNLDLFLNSVSWLLEDESLISIRGKEDEAGKIELSQQSGMLIFWLTVVIIPALIAVSGTVVWVRRRKL